jgi:DNA repair exonuclease SbcCD ATPase subunit
MEGQVEKLLHEMKEIGEALSEGNNALSQSQDILKSLQSAANWGTYDMFGGGMLATMAKRGHMDEAQKKIYSFQNTLRRYNQELQDVGDAYLPEFENDGFMRFADWFFDGFFVDWTVQSEINQVKEQVHQTHQAIENLQEQLQERFDECDKQMRNLLEQEEALVVKAEV